MTNYYHRLGTIILTLHIKLSFNKTFLAAKSRCTNLLFAKCFIPLAMSLQNLSSCFADGTGLVGLTLDTPPGLC